MQLFKTSFFFLLLLIISRCAPKPYAETNKAYKKQAKQLAAIIKKYPIKDSFATAPVWVGTTNFNLRKPNYVIIHHTAQKSCDQTLKTFTLTRTQVSSHYVICKDGSVYHMLNDYLRAWHGGVSKWGNTTDINSSSIGIEIDNDGYESFSEEQLTSLITLLGHLKNAFGIPPANFIGHADIAPTRKNDPNVNFPWQRLADSGFGIWWSDTTNMEVPAGFNSVQGLKIIGYDIRDSVAAIQAFKRKFLVQDKSTTLSDADRKVLYSLYRKIE